MTLLLSTFKIDENDGGSFVTLPQVYSEGADNPGPMNSNMGMYRIQLSGNDYEKDKEIGLHYQIHRGIGVIMSNIERSKSHFGLQCLLVVRLQ